MGCSHAGLPDVLAEVYPYRLPVHPQRYEVSHLDRAVPRIWRDEPGTPVVLHLPIHYFLRDYATPEAVYMLDSTTTGREW